MNGGTDASALNWRLTRTMVTGDQQNDPVTMRDRLLEAAVDGGPGSIESHSVKIEHAVGLDDSATQPFVPASVEGGRAV